MLTLLTTCVISGTFAKYTTQAGGSDTARVAKWGVEVAASGSLFATTYATDDANATTITNSVESSNDNEVVAPGTKSDKGITFEIKGTPEVAVRVDVKVTDVQDQAVKDIFLGAGTYADLTTGDRVDTKDGTSSTVGDKDVFTVANEYHPIKYTLRDGANKTLLEDVTLSQVEAYFKNLSGDYAAKTDLATELGKNQTKSTDGKYILTWAWDFPETENADTDKKDTLLGNLAANSSIKAKKDNSTGNFTELADTDFSTTTDIKIEISVTQID